MSRLRFDRIALFTAATLATAALVPAAAQAAEQQRTCPAAELTTPFTPWSDDALYQLAPDGDFEAGDGSWTLARGAATIEDNETAFVGDPSDHRALSLPAGSSATTASMCIGIEHRSMRFFVKRSGAGEGGSLKVDVLYTDAAGERRTRTIGDVDGDREWTPSPIVELGVNELAPDFGGALDIALRFTPQGGSWTIDDVYVDPWRKG